MKAIPTVPMRSDSAKNRGELHHHHRPSSAIIGIIGIIGACEAATMPSPRATALMPARVH
jgi:hypothetical protein